MLVSSPRSESIPSMSSYKCEEGEEGMRRDGAVEEEGMAMGRRRGCGWGGGGDEEEEGMGRRRGWRWGGGDADGEEEGMMGRRRG